MSCCDYPEKSYTVNNTRLKMRILFRFERKLLSASTFFLCEIRSNNQIFWKSSCTTGRQLPCHLLRNRGQQRHLDDQLTTPFLDVVVKRNSSPIVTLCLKCVITAKPLMRKLLLVTLPRLYSWKRWQHSWVRSSFFRVHMLEHGRQHVKCLFDEAPEFFKVQPIAAQWHSFHQ